MKKIIDNFSTQSKIYQKYQPVYPPELFLAIFSLVKNKQIAWDCGTGNGQVATILAKEFKQVAATDISKNQLKNALSKDNIQYALYKEQNLPTSQIMLLI